MPVETINSDQELFAKIAQGDEDAYRIVFHAWNSRLFHTVMKLVKSEEEAEEIIQEVFLRLWLQRHTLPSIQTPGAWLHTIASNLALDSLRRKARQQTRLKVIAESGNFDNPEPESQLDAKELQRLIDEAVEKLPASRRHVFILSRRQGLNRSEIAEQLNISESTVKNHLTAALKFIQDYLQNNKGLYLPAVLLLLFR